MMGEKGDKRTRAKGMRNGGKRMPRQASSCEAHEGQAQGITPYMYSIKSRVGAEAGVRCIDIALAHDVQRVTCVLNFMTFSVDEA